VPTASYLGVSALLIGWGASAGVAGVTADTNGSGGTVACRDAEAFKDASCR